MSMYVKLFLVLVIISLSTRQSRGIDFNNELHGKTNNHLKQGVEPTLALVGRPNAAEENSKANIVHYSGSNIVANMGIPKIDYSLLLRKDPEGYSKRLIRRRRRKSTYVAEKQGSGNSEDGKLIDGRSRSLHGSYGPSPTWYNPPPPPGQPPVQIRARSQPCATTEGCTYTLSPAEENTWSDTFRITHTTPATWPHVSTSWPGIPYVHNEKITKWPLVDPKASRTSDNVSSPDLRPLPPDLCKTITDIIIKSVGKSTDSLANKFKEYLTTFEHELQQGQLELTEGQIIEPVAIMGCTDIRYNPIKNEGVSLLSAPCMVPQVAFRYRYKMTFRTNRKVFTGRLQIVLSKDLVHVDLALLPTSGGGCHVNPFKLRMDEPSLKRSLASYVTYYPDSEPSATRNELLRNENIINSWLYRQFRRHVAGFVLSTLRESLNKAIPSINSGGQLRNVCSYILGRN